MKIHNHRGNKHLQTRKKKFESKGNQRKSTPSIFPPTVLLVTYRVRITTIVHRLYTTPLESYGPSGCDVKGQLSHSSVASYSHAREETSAPIDAVSGLVFSLFLFFFSPTRHGWIGRRRPIDVIAWLAARLKWPIGRHGRPLLAVLITYVSTWTTRPCGSHRIFSHTSAVVFLLAATVQPSSSIKTIVSGSSMEVFKLRDWRRNRDRGIVRLRAGVLGIEFESCD